MPLAGFHRGGKLYRYYVGQAALKGEISDAAIRRVSAAAIEATVVDQLRALLKSPEVVMATWRASKSEGTNLLEATVRESLERLDPLWDDVSRRASPHRAAVGPEDRPQA